MKERVYFLYDFEPWKILLHLPVFLIIYLTVFLPSSLIPHDITTSTKTILIVIYAAVFGFIIFILNSLLFRYFTSNKLTIIANQKLLDIHLRKRAKKEINLQIRIDSIEKIETKYFNRDTHYKIYYNVNQVFTITKNDLFVFFIKDDFKQFKNDIEQEISSRGLPIIN